MTGRWAAALLLAFVPSAAAAAPRTTAAMQLQEAERVRAAHLQAQREAAAKAQTEAAEADRLAAERVQAAASLRNAEAVTNEAAARVAALSDRRRELEAKLAARARAFAPLLPLLERLSLYPAETLLAVPAPPEQTLRGVLVLAGLSRQLEAEAAALRAEEQEVRALRARLAAEIPKLAAAQASQAREAAALDVRIAATQSARTAAEGDAAAAARRAAEDAARAETLRAAIAQIEANERAAAARSAQSQPPAREAAARPIGGGVGGGTLTSPVAGTVVRSFGESADAGPINGVSYQAAPSARVVSPCTGRVVFSGPFRSYGQLLIIDCGSGFHVVLAGLQRLDAPVGEAVRQGEPVGVMPGWDPSGGARRPTLYVELREHGDPVNPAPYLNAKS